MNTNKVGQKEEFAVEAVKVQSIDWHRHTFPLGVRTSLTEADPPYLALTATELEVLHKLLTRVLPGADTSAAREYLHLNTLAMWCREVAVWASKRT